MKEMKEVRLRFDFDGYLYLIPKVLTGVFDRECDFLDNIEYEDDPQSFDEFDTNWKKFRKQDMYTQQLFIEEN